ncbi:Trimeric GatFAB AmidoTransferase(AdT) complex subunit [Coemansia sp. RSA 353]|nr:Trimeric GatFAB AmidoTransferase(AdT) complex subunit [Coemansia sp. RSA 532]KAJ2229183.1 Trimeric GatFAB AmidoTransferase(AdT) complex subunit [Coemansia sp. RSA 518]KAJ2300798.1 Trimeric GatFAB AmidoTransferase(AdT) complex subunit [Coemansia sp. RSA 353]KAJ2408513.1 Trimeric GatFAB AmidoTransferase(AdT) complex subunit [Coemansia sp. RSA 2526]
MQLLLTRIKLNRLRLVCRYSTPSLNDTYEAISVHNPRLNALPHIHPLDPTQEVNGPLSGWSFAVKSNIASPLPTTCASSMLSSYTSPFSATAVTKLEHAGARMIGTSNMDEFGMGSLNQSSVHGPAHNLHPENGNVLHSPGGSSGGSAAAVAARMCRVALGSDTGGSVRLPASWCGVVGFKPSYGRVSRYGLVSYASSLDSVGILARSTQDIRHTFNIISAPDPHDMTCMSKSLRSRIDTLCASREWISHNTIASEPLKGVRVGVPSEFWVDELSPSAIDAWKRGAAKLESLGCDVIPVSLPHTPHTLPAYYTLALAEASSNLARFDGIRFGTRHPPTQSTRASLKYAQTRTMGFGDEVKRRILLGTFVMSARAYENYYLPSQRIRRLVQREFNRIFAMPNALCTTNTKTDARNVDKVDAILFPTATDTAPVQGSNNGLSAYVNDVMTVSANMAGIPAISVPFGLCEGMPLGLQIAAQYGDDDLVLRIARHLESQPA